jgi:hypothetical protein
MEQRNVLAALTRPGHPQAQPLPEAFLHWQLTARRAMLEAIASGGCPHRHPAHLPVRWEKGVWHSASFGLEWQLPCPGT